MTEYEMNDKSIQSVVEEYNRINNSFNKKVVFHVGDGAGFYSEVDAMMQCMLWCYARQIKFVLFADDANFSGGHGWQEFFEPFCEEDHNWLNHYGNHRFNVRIRDYKNVIQFNIAKFLLKRLYHIDYLTQDVFVKAIDTYTLRNELVNCEVFGVNGTSSTEFVKLAGFVLRYNKKTKDAIEKRVNSLSLPDTYCSVQLRGGDKELEYRQMNNVNVVIDRILSQKPDLKDLFIFTDDYSYITHVRENYSGFNVYTLTKENECGYVNEQFQNSKWEDKYDDMIKLFSMVEICLASDIHFGNECTCVNQYIKNTRLLKNKVYFPAWTEEEAESTFTGYKN